jgi:acyl-CoA reductase-like NAD-dependent aldehyde dehydrogenase
MRPTREDGMTAQVTHLTGENLIAGHERRAGSQSIHAIDPRTQEPVGPPFHEATHGEITDAVDGAVAAFKELRSWSDTQRVNLLRAIAHRLESATTELTTLADRETALGVDPRLNGELARTTNQLRSFARLVEQGWYVDAIIDTTGPDVRRMLVPLGPVAVFGASNFPLAFGVPGGDTASALAAGCPVVAKAHPSNPGTSELAARLILAALDDVDAPKGTFSLVQGASPEAGTALVEAPGIRAVAFTGSLAGGRALATIGATRPEPIPVYAEMGSVNPIFVFPAAARARAADIASGGADSITMGTGQFCTKPGLVFVPAGESGEVLLKALTEELVRRTVGSFLNVRIDAAFHEDLQRLRTLPGVETRLEGEARPTLFVCDLDTFLHTPDLHEEHFGPVAVAVRYPPERLEEAVEAMPGSLTATVHADEADQAAAARLLDVLTDRAGRLVHNGFPTGVAVVPAMHHGGPYPATTAPGHTSVGMTAIRRFLRPVAYQDVPDSLLPPQLQSANPYQIPRLVDWVWTADPLTGEGA